MTALNLTFPPRASRYLRVSCIALFAILAPACSEGQEVDPDQEESAASGSPKQPSTNQAEPSQASKQEDGSQSAKKSEPDKGPKKPQEPKKPVKENPEWDYEEGGDMGPDKWGDLSPAYATCKSGDRQSPIDITKTKRDPDLATIKAEFTPVPYEAVDTGHTIQVNIPSGQFITVGEEKYELVQFHLHAGSEHTIQGKRFPLEIQLVHKTKTGSLGMFGVMVKAGNPNKTFKTILENLPDPGSTITKPKLNIDPSGIFPLSLQYFGYDGSLTTPPCTEGVRWHVLKTPITASQEQIDAFKKLYGPTHRPAQPRNSRVVVSKYRL